MTPRAATAVGSGTPEELSILRSVLYASLFDYPLSVAELQRSLIESTQTAESIVQLCSTSCVLRDALRFDGTFVFPAGREDLVGERKEREQRSRVFLRAHERVLRAICSLPFVRMVALSGSIAHLNLDEHGDLDLFVVTRGRHVWSTTVAIILLAKLMRRRGTVCANFVVADTHLAMEQQDLFTANQILHLKPLVGEDMYLRFLEANPFVARFYPNAMEQPASTPNPAFRTQPFVGRPIARTLERVLAPTAAAAECVCRIAYRLYLKRQASSWRSPDQVRLDPDYLKLHTHSHRRSTMIRFDGADIDLSPERTEPRGASLEPRAPTFPIPGVAGGR